MRVLGNESQKTNVVDSAKEGWGCQWKWRPAPQQIEQECDENENLSGVGLRAKLTIAMSQLTLRTAFTLDRANLQR
jgi:hypothetical protein